VSDPAEIQARIPQFMERAGYYYEHWDELHENWEKKMREIINDLKCLEVKTLPQMEDLSVVREGLGISSGYELLASYDKLIDLGIRCWQYHFEFLNLGYAAYVTFVDFCSRVFPDLPLQKISQMVGGVNVIIYQPDEELKKLAKLAMQTGLADQILSAGSIDNVTRQLNSSESGRKWLAAWDAAKDPWFYISTGTGWYHHDASWNDDLNVPLNSLRVYIEKLKQGHAIDRPLGNIQAERERLVKEYRGLLQTDEDRNTFDQLHGTSNWCSLMLKTTCSMWNTGSIRYSGTR